MKVSPTNVYRGTAGKLTSHQPTCIYRNFQYACSAMLVVLFAFLLLPAATAQAQTASAAPITGEVERLTLNSQQDPWSGGVIVVGGQNIIIPRNLLMDLPANRLTLSKVFAQAPAACLQRAESGLAKADVCNSSRTGAIATIHANRTSAGNVIAGDVFIQKGTETVKGKVTYINYTDGYFRLNGILNDANTGVMVRLNDPSNRHSVQQGLGCQTGSVNCSPDPRFTLDPDNYTNTFSTGVPSCIPSTVSRSFIDTLDLDGDGNTTETLSTASSSTGTGDLLCPSTNRTADLTVADSRRFAPIQIGDGIEAEGNFETINDVKFLSAHTTMVSRALGTRNVAGQPDYLTLDEVGIDAPGFQNQRARTLFIGFASLNTDVMIWGLHYDPTNNVHEFPLATVVGCDNAGGAGTCGQNGLAAGIAGNIWKIRHDVDFLDPATKPRLDPCAHLRADPRFAASNPCPGGGTFEEQFGILSPVPHEIMARTGRKFADATGSLKTIDILGNPATNGEYLFPLGLGLGGIVAPEFVEIDLDALDTAFSFSGLPWNLDRRLGPGGCNGPCETTPQPLDPFPFEIFDPRTQAPVPTGAYNDPTFTASALTNASNRILSYVDATIGKFNGNSTVLAWPPANPAFQPITPTNIYKPQPLVCDVTAPTAPTSLVAGALNPTTINLSWSASTDNIGVTNYLVFRDTLPSPIASVVGTAFSDTGLTPLSSHSYRVIAIDGAGNLSGFSNTATANTPADTSAPSAPTDLTAVGSNSTTINLSWTASTDNVDVVGYQVFRDGGTTPIATVSVTNFSDTGLAVGSTHTYTVKAVDAANNQSGTSNTVTASTLGNDTTAPSAPTGLTATGSLSSTLGS